MPDPTYTPQDFLSAEMILDHLLQNRAIQFQVEGDTFNRATMQTHVNERAALVLARKLLLDECERIVSAEVPVRAPSAGGSGDWSMVVMSEGSPGPFRVRGSFFKLMPLMCTAFGDHETLRIEFAKL